MAQGSWVSGGTAPTAQPMGLSWPQLASAPQFLEQEPLEENPPRTKNKNHKVKTGCPSHFSQTGLPLPGSLCSSDAQPFVSDLLGSVYWPGCPGPF